nr:Cu(I)-responsive transcriptional regulator [Pseudomonas aeruginosa]EKY0487492.1 Cu(I)-responsive transcriptional regulator [Pseudomonas aeruginosa]
MNIGEAAKKSGLTPKMIRYYESIELLRPAGRSASGYRHYNENDLHTLAFIRRSRDLGFSLDEVGKLLTLWQDRQRASADVKALAAQHVRELNRKIEELSTLRDTLQDLVEHCQGDHRPDCPILKRLAAATDIQQRPARRPVLLPQAPPVDLRLAGEMRGGPHLQRQQVVDAQRCQ